MLKRGLHFGTGFRTVERQSAFTVSVGKIMVQKSYRVFSDHLRHIRIGIVIEYRIELWQIAVGIVRIRWIILPACSGNALLPSRKIRSG